MNSGVKQLLDTVEVGAMATINRDRTPLVTPLHFARLDDSIIWISEPDARHTESAMRTGKLEFVVWDAKKQAVYLKTSVMRLPDEDKDRAMRAYKDKLGDFLPCSEKREIYISPIGQLDDNSTTGNWWHFVA